MRPLTTLALISLLPALARASELELKEVFLPLYVKYAVVEEGEVPLHAKPRPIRLLSRGAYPETTIGVLNSPFIPRHDATWHEPTDANLISICRISLSYTSKELDTGGASLEIIIDTSSFAKPKDVEISEEEVNDLIVRAVAQNFPDATVAVKNGEAAGGQPGTQSKSESGGGANPQLGSGRRSG